MTSSGKRAVDWALSGIAGLSPYVPGKPVEELERELGIQNIVKLASNENPRGPGPGVRQALAEAERQLSRYPDGSCFELRRELAAHHRVEPQQLTFGNGSNDVLELIARVFLAPGRSGICIEHAFVVYKLAIVECGATLVEVPAHHFGVDLSATVQAIRADTRVVFLANPNNPTGMWVTNHDLTAFLDAVPNDVVVVLDEAYREYVQRDDYPDGLELLARYPNLVVTRTFSKIYGLAALRLGYAVSSPEIADLMNRVRQPFNVNALAQAAGLAALADRDYVNESRRLNNAGMRQVCDGLSAIGVDYLPSVGNFLCVDCGASAAPVYQALLEQGVIVRPIASYGMPNHLRVTIGLPEENARFLGAFATARNVGRT